jgi:hypothetical protein
MPLGPEPCAPAVSQQQQQQSERNDERGDRVVIHLLTWLRLTLRALHSSWQLPSPYRDGQLHQGGVQRSSCCCTGKTSRAQGCSECGEPTGRREFPNRGRKDCLSSFRNNPNLVPYLFDIARFARDWRSLQQM